MVFPRIRTAAFQHPDSRFPKRRTALFSARKIHVALWTILAIAFSLIANGAIRALSGVASP